jgi:hypothetical protein
MARDDDFHSIGMRTRRAARRARAVALDLRRVRQLRALRQEIASLRADHPGLTTDLTHHARPPARHVLLVSLSDDPQEIRLAALLGKSVQLQGGRMSVLVFRAARRSARLFRALGLTELVYYEDFVPGRRGLDPETLGGLERCRTVADYKAFEVEGVRVGRQALSTVVRSSHEPRVDLGDPAVRLAIRRTVEYAVESIHVGNGVLDTVAPDCLLMLERGYAGLGSLFDRALVRGIPVIQWQSAHRDDAFFLKRYTLDAREFHARSLEQSTWKRLLEVGLTEEREAALAREMAAQEEGKWFLSRRTRHAAQGENLDALRDSLGLDRDRKVAVLFSHVLWDASMFYGRDLFSDQGQWFEETVRVAAEDDRVQWLVKLHPSLYWKLRFDGVHEDPAELEMIREAVGHLPTHMHLVRPDDRVSNVDLFRIIDAGVTIRGTVGIELPPLGVPVITAGTSDYSGKGFTLDADTVEQYVANLRSIADLERLSAEQVRLAKLYAFGIYCVRPWRFESFSIDYLPLDEAGDTLEHRLRYNVRTLSDLEHADDLAAFARWVVDSDEEDFVNEQALAAPQPVGST